ncbi:WecB/TagA/CpsF family glycosyltransferase [Corynebacterium cystitidis]|uniref:Glycosyl transferase WecB/TagA/CpsF family protein n=1 Tax=Corynebacterium cystitidis DSM 20524 TaxID=1121357 RepID=A0A1H9W2J2_9CORY|nr:WecB/TagA/CpsF family glycosyltransferase [Corynebacterium cystitidis]WJY83005.1 UDP-Gal:alpha-D-GlcNAc-diphosphoundecaprenol beta-1,4-galactosyltransferase [Corynebacterium cystitidis DSM 20524]SES28125.1 Glycosyl transferase WecB/TagA/CpsF family protein [Corynebacterium cystitidis DSM 20524]SNV64807.1 putative UDP-N-acetyl-D-mannosaminuronic acid transferase [Corynebacterium cystitidis]
MRENDSVESKRRESAKKRSASPTASPAVAATPAVKAFALSMNQPGTVATWLNHWSVQRARWSALAQIDLIGVDGTLLQMLLRTYGFPLSRTSADLVLPVFFGEVAEPGTRVALIGAKPGVAQRSAKKLQHTYRLVACGFDGYGQLGTLRDNPEELAQFAPDVIVLGLGAGLQDEVAVEFHRHFPQAIICTAGGWIDQFAAKQQYFPAWVHRLRLGWAWRIYHEPRRLLGRYTRDALGFLVGHRRVIRKILALPHQATITGLQRAETA